MQKIFEKIMDELKQESIIVDDDAGNRAVEIIEKVVGDYNNGWIPCSERLPEEHDSMLARFKVTDKWRDSMFEKTSNEVIVTISDEKGEKVTTHAHTTDGTWKCDILRACPTYRVIAWQPFPDPYQPLSNDSTDAGAGYEKSAWRDLILRNFMRGSEV